MFPKITDLSGDGVTFSNLDTRFLVNSASALNSAFSASNSNNTDQWNWNNYKSEADLNRAYNAEQAALNRQFQSDEAQKNREWQENMSNSAYSRAIADLRANGVNPYAVLSGLSSASTPSGGSVTGSSAYSNSTPSSYTSATSVSNNMLSSFSKVASAVVSNAFDLFLLAKLIFV